MINKLQELAKDRIILYAEDEESVRVPLISILEKFFEKVLVAKDGQEAIEIFKNERVDIVLTDIAMPHKNGLDLTEFVKNVDKDIPVLISTAFNDSEYFLRAISLNVSKFILKPVDVKNLLSNLVDVLENIKIKEDLELYKRSVLENGYAEKCEEIIESMLNLVDTPFLVCNDTKTLFFNNSFLKEIPDAETFMECNSDELEDKTKSLEDKFELVKTKIYTYEEVTILKFIKRI